MNKTAKMVKWQFCGFKDITEFGSVIGIFSYFSWQLNFTGESIKLREVSRISRSCRHPVLQCETNASVWTTQQSQQSPWQPPNQSAVTAVSMTTAKPLSSYSSLRDNYDDVVSSNKIKSQHLRKMLHEIQNENQQQKRTFDSLSKSLSSAISETHLVTESPVSCSVASWLKWRSQLNCNCTQTTPDTARHTTITDRQKQTDRQTDWQIVSQTDGWKDGQTLSANLFL